MPWTRRVTAGALAVTLGSGLLAGTLAEGSAGAVGRQSDGDNGVADKSPRRIAVEARRAFDTAQSMHVKTDSRGGKPVGGVRSVDLAVDRNGNCVGTVVQQGDQGRFEVIRHGDNVWFKPDAAWLRAHLPGSAGEKAAKELAGKYLSGKVDQPGIGQVTKMCDLDALQQRVSTAGTNWYRKGQRSEVEGKQAIGIEGRARDKNVTLDVATQGTPYPVRSTVQDDGTKSTATFTFGERVPNKTPRSDQTTPWKG